MRLLGLKILRLNGWNIAIVGVVVDNDGDVDESNSPEWIENLSREETLKVGLVMVGLPTQKSSSPI